MNLKRVSVLALLLVSTPRLYSAEDGGPQAAENVSGFPCGYPGCLKIFAARSHARAHRKSVGHQLLDHSKKDFKCEPCKRSFGTEKGLNKHKKDKKATCYQLKEQLCLERAKPFFCKRCKKVGFDYKKALETHQETCVKIKKERPPARTKEQVLLAQRLADKKAVGQGRTQCPQ